MSLPNYLAKIKSSGVFRFTWDKSVVPPQQAETLRLVVGYSEKGPFNTPVYIESVSDFISIYGNISKRLERKGVYFHRMAQQALQAGPILALNLKPFGESEKVGYASFNKDIEVSVQSGESGETVKGLYDTKRFWKLDADVLPKKLTGVGDGSYFYLTTTDTKENSCSVVIRKYVPDSYNGITLRQWYATQSLEIPEAFESILDTNLSDYFAEVYVFRGQFTKELAGGGALKKYFNVGQDDEVTIKKSGSGAGEYSVTFGEADALKDLANDSNSNFVGAYSGCILPYFKDANGNYISLDLKFNADYNNHKMLMKINEDFAIACDETTGVNFGISGSNLTVDTTPGSDLNIHYFEGYTYGAITTGTIWSNCCEVIKDLYEPLTNNVDVEYHYIVDTFDSDSEVAKNELFAIAKAKDNAFAIVNFPKMSNFDDVNDAKTTFGPNMPSEVEGASWGAYYTQLTFSDGTVKSVVPSAALVSNLFMEKWGARQPYYIVAGPTFGRLSYSGLIGPDYNFGRSDLDVLEPMGINAIIYVPRLGTYINSNQTAKQVPVSGLSKIHIRELVIFLQNEVQNLLQSYQWELNTQTLRDTIKSKADAICETILNNGGLYAYKNVCDETNNTAEVIDNEMIILDTEIEPARGAGKMVHQLTIHKTGGLTSSVK